MTSRDEMPSCRAPSPSARVMPASTVSKATPRAVWVWGSKNGSTCLTVWA